MAGHSHLRLPAEEPADFAAKTLRISVAAKGAAVVGIVVAVVMSFVGNATFRQFYFAWLTGLGFFLAMAMGALFFVLIHHCTRAGWSVNVRRVAENMAAMIPLLGALFLPIFFSVIIQRGDLYRWALPESAVKAEKAEEPESADATEQKAIEHDPKAATVEKMPLPEPEGERDPGRGNRTIDHVTLLKRPWLNPIFFCVRMVAYFAIWSIIAMYFFGHSTRQDLDGDYRHTVSMQRLSAPCLVIFGLTFTLAAWDIFMSLDPHWYSTMFGVYFFAGGVQSFFAAMVVIIYLMQKGGYLREAVTTEHYHDLGKYLFAFTFFFGYITFSQYMLLWYASIPEEVGWPSRHGMTTARLLSADHNPATGDQWQIWSLLVLFGAILIPFAGLMSRHMKRKTGFLVFWAVWILIFQFVNQVWIVIPEMLTGFNPVAIAAAALALIGIGGVLAAAWLRLTARHKLRPMNDPRMAESAAFINI